MREPIQQRYRESMNVLAHQLDEALNGTADHKKIGFVLLMAEFDRIDGGRVNYISNGDRSDMIAMMKEWLARAEGRYSDQGGKA